MTATNHALTGAVIALAVKQPALAIPLALLSHFAIDVIPHFDLSRKHPKAAKYFTSFDMLCAGAVMILIPLLLTTPVSAWLIFACMVLAVLPDSVWAWRYYKFRDIGKVISAKPISRLTRLHQRIQLSETPRGLIIEVAWLILMALLISNLRT
ncbi:MAG TPA: hypothetical protein VFP32_02350 [Candidatus Saccharimonadales bacterium]|nr:hypothetical protein [Candidatus Saccharimonadales bacterium]